MAAEFTLCFGDTGEEARVTLPMLGLHQIYNALQAAAVGRIFNMKIEEIVAGLENFEAPEMRMQLEQIGDVRIFNDAYNANPDSMVAALAAFRHVRATGRKIVVLGDMYELGEQTQAAHEEVGRTLAQGDGVKVVVTVGAFARVIGRTAIRHGLEEALVVAFDTAEDAAKFLKMESRAGDCILLKGSRRVGLERIVQVLREQAQQRGAAGEAEMATARR
jgi:UDP-N-acetylmuramoyl-tripeptide--D-alanyl-D-alanine ligase